jgi:hypothetical protein
LKHMKVNGKDYPIHYGKTNVWNHQPEEIDSVHSFEGTLNMANMPFISV